VRKFKVTLQGRNLLLEIDRVAKHGVVAVRFVEAIDEVVAGHAALENFQSEPKAEMLRSQLLNPDNDAATFEIREVIEVDSFDGVENLHPGLIFYPET
jgi:hypothetical protein